MDLAKDKNRRSPGAHAFLARDFARAIRFAKPSTTWHFCQVCSLICQIAQIANSKCKTVGYPFWSFLANYSKTNLKCKTLGDALTIPGHAARTREHGPKPVILARSEGHWARAGTARGCRPCLGRTLGPQAGPARQITTLHKITHFDI